MFSRNCNQCQRLLSYSNRKAFLRATKNDSRCKRCSNSGRKLSEETKEKMRLNHADVSGNKNPNFGKSSVLKGKTWEEIHGIEKSTRLKQDISNNPRFLGHKHSEQTKKKIKEKMIGENNPFYKKTHTKETIDKVRNYTLGQIQRGEFKHAKNTSIENTFQGYLQELGLEFQQYKIFGHWTFDFYLPKYDIFIECDGDYWHANPFRYNKDNLNQTQKHNLANDNKKNKYMLSRNKTLIRFWENDILNNKNYIIAELKNKLNI